MFIKSFLAYLKAFSNKKFNFIFFFGVRIFFAGHISFDITTRSERISCQQDTNENDGGQSLPWDEPNGMLEGGWATMLTVLSVDGGATESGEPRINLKKTDLETLQIRLGLEEPQAQALITLATSDNANLGTLLTNTLRSVSNGMQDVTNLTDEQLKLIFAETALFDPHEAPPGRMNINTISPELLYTLFPDNKTLVEELLYLRVNNSGGISSPLDYRDIAGIAPNMVTFLYDIFDTRSSVFTISSKGMATASQVEQEIIVVVDRSTIPVTILEYREQ